MRRAIWLGALLLPLGCSEGGSSTQAPAAAVWSNGPLAGPAALTSGDVTNIITQSVNQATAVGSLCVVAVVDREGFILGAFAMTGAPAGPAFPVPATADPTGAIGVNAAISKARTAAFLSSNQQAFSSRTAAFIVDRHFPPGVEFTAGGPLFGVQNSSDTGSDVRIDPNGISSIPVPLPDPNGLTGSFGGLPLYKDGKLVGGVGVSGTAPTEDERIAAAGTNGYAAPPAIRADQILIDGIRLPFEAIVGPLAPVTVPFGALPGAVVVGFPIISSAGPSSIPAVTLGGVTGELWYPIVAGTGLTTADVTNIIAQSAQRCAATRAAIRRPIGAGAQVWISVVDTAGNILGVFRTPDATLFSFDVSVQKARTAVVYSDGLADPRLGEPVDVLPLGMAVTTRAVGFMAQPLYPPGIEQTAAGPLFGVQDALPLGLGSGIAGLDITPGVVGDVTDGNGITIFPGGIPLYKGGVFVGAIGVSGDGVDQDDYIAEGGTIGFEPPPAIRCDNFFVRGARLPYIKVPRNPNEP